MSEHLDESISALMDEEADDLELGRVLRRARHNDEVRATWSRYHLISAVMRGQPSVLDRLEPAASMAALADQEPDRETGAGTRNMRSFAAPRERSRRLRRAAAGVATAAAGFLAAVLVLRPLDSGREAAESEPSLASAPETATASPAIDASNGPTGERATRAGSGQRSRPAPRAASAEAGEPMATPGEAPAERRFTRVDRADRRGIDPAVARQVEAYMLRHAEHNALNNRNSMLPMAKVAAFELE